MQNTSKISNIRYTIFFDKVFPFSISIANIFKDIIKNSEVTPIIFPAVSNVFIPGQSSQDWGLIENTRSILEVHGNKMDFFSYEDNTDQSFIKYVSIFNSLIEKLSIKIRRLAFAPTYELLEPEIEKFYSANLKAIHFGGAQIQDFSMNRVYYKVEDIEGCSFNVIYNCTVAIQNLSMINPNEKKKLIVLNDINTRDTGTRIYDEKEIKVFFSNAFHLNDKFIKFLKGE